jgi:tRNA-splicing ligase RtcB (3'-phosphate/5'-hydroxy nucleic acid ligase)
MKTIVNNKGNTVIIYAGTFENEAYEQVKALANFPAYENSLIRIMPDAHAGKGCTVGTTMTITDKVTPNLTGVDGGCGMLTVKLKNKEIDFKKLDEVINLKVPHGFNVHEKAKAKFDFTNLRCAKKVDLSRALLSIGSLGGGEMIATVLVNN